MFWIRFCKYFQIVLNYFLIVKFSWYLKDAASILEEIYCKYANASQRAALVEEFYGPEFAVFKVCFYFKCSKNSALFILCMIHLKDFLFSILIVTTGGWIRLFTFWL